MSIETERGGMINHHDSVHVWWQSGYVSHITHHTCITSHHGDGQCWLWWHTVIEFICFDKIFHTFSDHRMSSKSPSGQDDKSTRHKDSVKHFSCHFCIVLCVLHPKIFLQKNSFNSWDEMKIFFIVVWLVIILLDWGFIISFSVVRGQEAVHGVSD